MNEYLELYYPFENIISGSIQDFSGNNLNAKVSGSPNIVNGKIMNALRFNNDNDKVKLSALFDFMQDFTIGFFVNFFTAEIINISFNKNLSVLSDCSISQGWHNISLTKSGNEIIVYLDFTEINSETITEAINSFQINTDSGNAFVLDEFRIYSTVLNSQQLKTIFAVPMYDKILYSINGIDFENFGVRVRESNGLFDLPKIKKTVETDWADYHGKVIDLQAKRYDVREISLRCWLKADGKEDFTAKFNDFCSQFQKSGLNRLKIEINSLKPLIYEVYNNDGIEVKKQWRNVQMFGEFTLKLIEPEPFKRVIRFDGAQGTVSCNSDKMLSFYWGDGTVEELYGNINRTHTFTTSGQHYTLIYGVIEEIKNLTTNGIIIW